MTKMNTRILFMVSATLVFLETKEIKGVIYVDEMYDRTHVWVVFERGDGVGLVRKRFESSRLLSWNII